MEAWGTDKDLFARGVAEIVTDPKLAAETLAAPGTVINKSRGGLAEQLAADQSRPSNATTKSRGGTKPVVSPRPAKPKPRPSRKELDDAKAALATHDAEAETVIEARRREEDALREKREAITRQQDHKREALTARVDRASTKYDVALERWRNA